ncbi:MAG: glycosyltransferase family 1 protein, partial [Deltaproteobacteria bacterium]
IFTGNITDPEKVLAAADILVHPTFYDACSLTVIEAMASGIPVITTKYNGASGLITDGKEGFVIDSPKDISQLKQKIRYFFDIEKRISSGNMARKKAESLSIDINCKKIMELFQRWL